MIHQKESRCYRFNDIYARYTYLYYALSAASLLIHDRAYYRKSQGIPQTQTSQQINAGEMETKKKRSARKGEEEKKAKDLRARARKSSTLGDPGVYRRDSGVHTVAHAQHPCNQDPHENGSFRRDPRASGSSASRGGRASAPSDWPERLLAAGARERLAVRRIEREREVARETEENGEMEVPSNIATPRAG